MADFLHPFFLFLSISFFHFFSSITAQYDAIDYRSCPSYNCGNITNSYPFWKIGDQTAVQYCGYQGFGINCSTIVGQQIPSINLGRDRYYVKHINYDRRDLLLVDYDFSEAVNVPQCPRVRHSIDMRPPFIFSEDNVNISFHFNCTGSPSFARRIPCMNLGERNSYVYPITSEVKDSDWSAYSCEAQVVTTVVQYILDRLGVLSSDFSRALSAGFVLGWGKRDDCQKCEDSQGRCGHYQITNEFMCLCFAGISTMNDCRVFQGNWQVSLALGVQGIVLWMVPVFTICFTSKSSLSNCIASLKRGTKDDRNVETFISQYDSLTTKRYKYVDIQKMTSSFQVKLGQGGFGAVFKGKLLDGRVVAVKVLNPSKASGQEFINEVASIGRTSHINIVALLGFCSENQKRALIYEFMPNGSLEKYIYDQNPDKPNVQIIGVMKLYEIALGIARGLDYLHRGCNTRILHLDIKPHNILLDEDFCPKIADFGLAKLYSKKESIVSMLEARGTIGYIAPEVFSRNFGGVSHKSDVYSYGMLILEMVGGRKNVDGGVGSGHTSEIYFPYWIYDRLGKDEFLFDGVTNIEENEYARKMTIVGLWCIQTDPRQRPSINGVIEMLEGSMQALEVPPKPFFSSPPRTPATMLISSENGQEVISIDEPHK